MLVVDVGGYTKCRIRVKPEALERKQAKEPLSSKFLIVSFEEVWYPCRTGRFPSILPTPPVNAPLVPVPKLVKADCIPTCAPSSHVRLPSIHYLCIRARSTIPNYSLALPPSSMIFSMSISLVHRIHVFLKLGTLCL